MKRAGLLAISVLAAACATAPPPAPPAPPPPRALLGQHGLDLTNIDRSIGACEDFYQYATGGWRTAHPLPAIYPRYGRFEEVAERNREKLKNILETASKDATAEAGSGTRKIGD